MMTPMFYVNPKKCDGPDNAEAIAQQLHAEVPCKAGEPAPYRVGVGTGESTTSPSETARLEAKVADLARAKSPREGAGKGK